MPASPTWSAHNRRYAVEHPLAKEKERAQAQQHTQGRSIKEVMLLLPVVGILLLFYAFSNRIPRWLLWAGGALLQGRAPTLTSGEMSEVIGGGIVLLLVLVGGLFLVVFLQSRLGGSRIYDQRLAEEKTSRPAYRARLRIYVIAPGAPLLAQTAAKAASAKRHKRWFLSVQQMTTTLRAWDAKRTLQTLWRKRRLQRQSAREVRARRKEREEMLRLLAAPYRQYHLAAGGYFLLRRLSARRVRLLLRPPGRRWFWRQGWATDVRTSLHFLSVADLAALWHLPQEQDLQELAYVERQIMRTLPVPPVLTQGDGYLLGEATHAGQHQPVFFPSACLQQNILAVASTGKGKSTLFEHILRAFAQARITGLPEGTGGVLLMDPHGDLAVRVAGCLPASLADEVVLIELADRAFPIGFNPLDMSQGQDRDKTIDNLIAVIEALWPTSYGPRTESFVEYGAKSLADANQTLIARDPLHGPEEQFTLLDLVALFRNEGFRHAVMELVTDQYVLNWWNHYYEQLDGHQQADFTSSLVTKMSKFASSRISRRILGQARSSLNFGELIAEQKILLISCAAGEVGADLAALFGSLYLGFFQAALQEQAPLELVERKHFFCLIDEFQALVGVNYQSMLAELRKYGGNFALATQSLAYLDRFERTLRATVLANVEHIFAFAMADEDARLLRLPGVEPEDMTQLANYSCYARLAFAEQRLPVFSMRLAPPEEVSRERRQVIRNRCQTRYGRPVGLVEQGLRESETRQHTLKANPKRKGQKGYQVLWQGTGEERVEEVLEKTREKEQQAQQRKQAAAEHTLYAQADAEKEPPADDSSTATEP